MRTYRKVPSDRCEGGFTPLRRERTISNSCGSSSRVTAAESNGPQSTVLVMVVSVSVMVVALAVAGLFMLRRMLRANRTPAYRFSALQLQEEEQCIPVGPSTVAVRNGGGYHSDSDEDLIDESVASVRCSSVPRLHPAE
ncbi:hypothetical protein AAFF_G00167940 [Aldrovandia affinis]|uniref:Uncharacterized protein n=1 Tax=Aldrovandia affinis TaxID=143900 RepID=A0AAD7RLV4_9TELE|nr:hypothetical protein AAFF_G00167940 [Aldrovandia affinis]